jgi:fatty acyl-CoA reductase
MDYFYIFNFFFSSLIKLQKKIRKGVETLEFFTQQQWEFTNDNLCQLMSEMSATDLKNFNFDVRKLIWPTYMEEYIIGTKKHVLKEDFSRIPKCREDIKRFFFFFF